MMPITIEPYKQIPFKEKGRDYSGADCWGFVRLVHKEQLGNDLPMYSEGYCTTQDGEEIAAMIRKEREISWTPIDRSAVREGDVVVLRILGEPWHCGVMINKTLFAHMERSAGLVRDSIESMRWEKRIEGFYRWQPL